MEEIKVEIISKEDIKPSSPTPSHLRTFKHSILDQVFPYPYTIIILFYTSHNLSEFPKRLELLKQSLSETLTHFYPLGGRIKDDLSIDCNDECANFVVTKINCPITKILSKPDIYSLEKFLPVSISQRKSIRDHVINIQVNVFDCGGIAIGFCISHRILDADSLSTFLKVWTERINQNCNLKPLTKPNFETISLFPTSTLHFRDVSKKLWGSALKETKWITRRFLFTNSTIATLKAQILENHHPTRVEIVSALLWKFFMAASKAHSETQKPSLVTHAVNLRKRMDESLRPENSIGNFLWFSIAKHMDEHESSLDELVSKLKKSIQQVDKHLDARFQSDHEEGSSIIEDGLRNRLSKTRVEALERLALNSWCNFEFYDAYLTYVVMQLLIQDLLTQGCTRSSSSLHFLSPAIHPSSRSSICAHSRSSRRLTVMTENNSNSHDSDDDGVDVMKTTARSESIRLGEAV
ncbi:hypothetical protein PIB30_058877 [Stylosanthes scabra]|uniref:Uncharacterized protein n=1 Tax=Stylosanthes scabra TaxID=79078 RepID=A0ABU6VJP3_9FABA|nr:hypothetical protein [Stylosanthes scabra]